MFDKLISRKYSINIILCLIAIGLIVFYSICGSSCSYLRGSIFGIDLKYMGIVYMGVLVLLNILKKDLPLLLLVSFGIGTEVFLVGFQVRNGVYCPYCLIFGLIIVSLFLLNLNVTRKKSIALAILAGYIAFALFFQGTATPVYTMFYNLYPRIV